MLTGIVASAWTDTLMDRTAQFHNDALAATAKAQRHVTTAQGDLETAVARALHWDATWAQIADALDVTRQSAHRRYRHLRWDPDTQTAWTEPPLPM